VAGSGGPSLCAGNFALACAAMSTAPHDALFKAVFSQAELAAEELRCVLPPELVAQMDLTSLTLEAGSFVDEELREQHTDLLYSVRLAGRPARVYVLFEHQSKGEWWMALRLLRYMLRIWELCVADGAQQLPVIVPVVLHHGETGWRAATCFEGLFDLPPEAREFTPHFRFVLDDLAAHSEAALLDRAASAFTRLVLSALQQMRGERALAELLRGWAGLLREVGAAPNGQRALRLLFRYIFVVRGAEELATIDAIDSVAVEIPRGNEENMDTVDQQFDKFLDRFGRQEGLQQGRQEGRQEGERRLVLRQLRRRFGELPEALRERVEAAQCEELERWSDRLLSAGSLDEVFAEEPVQ
jgi:predicted transposase/invertase (TIGR01784 family)